MPRYLRWIAAGTAGIVIQFAVQILFLALFVGIAHRKELSGAAGAFVTFGATILNIVAALAVNDWLASRYPIERGDGSRPQAAEGTGERRA